MLHIHLFGQLKLLHDTVPLEELESRRAQELLCYLLLHRNRIHARETLAGLFWGDSPTAQAKKSLRQTLWLLQTALERFASPTQQPVLNADPEWVRVNPRADLWLDVEAFEHGCDAANGVQAEAVDGAVTQSLQVAVALYEGDLLEGWYQDWCLFERERLQNKLLLALDKLVAQCEIRQAYEEGLAYGMQLLRYDRARERTHRRLMRLLYLSGDRSGALRQYERCVAALHEELDAKPARSTVSLYQQILADRLIGDTIGSPTRAVPVLAGVLVQLKQLSATLTTLHSQVQAEIDSLEALGPQDDQAQLT